MTALYSVLLGIVIMLLVLGLLSPKTITKLTRKKITPPNPLIWGLTFGFVSVILTALVGFNVLQAKKQNALTSKPNYTQTAPASTGDIITNENTKTETDTPAPASSPKQSVQAPAPKESPEETAYKQLFVSANNAVATSANSAQAAGATSESVAANKQEVINQRSAFNAAPAPANRSNSRNTLIRAMDTLINNYFANRGSSITCTSGSSQTTQILYQACITRKTNANGAFSQYVSEAQLANSYFQQGN